MDPSHRPPRRARSTTICRGFNKELLVSRRDKRLLQGIRGRIRQYPLIHQAQPCLEGDDNYKRRRTDFGVIQRRGRGGLKVISNNDNPLVSLILDDRGYVALYDTVLAT